MSGITQEKQGFTIRVGENQYAFAVKKILQLPPDIQHDMQLAIQKDAGVEGDSGTYTIASGYTNMLRPWSAIITFEDCATHTQKTYLVKPPHHINELELSLRASKLGIGPRVIYANPQLSIFVEEFFPGPRGIYSVKNRAETLSEEEKVIVGKRLAEKTFLMYEDRPYGTPIAQGGDYSQHLLLLGNDKAIDVVFVDWGQYRNPNTPESILEEIGLEFAFVTTFFEDPKVMISFLQRFYELGKTSQYNLAPTIVEAYKQVRSRFTSKNSLHSKKLKPYFEKVEEDETIAEIVGKHEATIRR